jgi:Spy/CpxP family protein refolding chaperone
MEQKEEVNNMKKILPLVMAAMMLAGGVSFANEMGMGKGKMTKAEMDEHMAKKHDDMLKKMNKELNLTAEQSDKVSTILKNRGEQKKSSMTKMKDQEMEIMDKEDQEIKAVLTPEQQGKYDQMITDRKKRMEKKMK